MSALLAVLLAVFGVTYAAWPAALRGRAQTLGAGECGEGAGLESSISALRDWALAAGEVQPGETVSMADALAEEDGDE